MAALNQEAPQDGLSRCDGCGKITPHEVLIQIPHTDGTLAYYCCWECTMGYVPY